MTTRPAAALATLLLFAGGCVFPNDGALLADDPTGEEPAGYAEADDSLYDLGLPDVDGGIVLPDEVEVYVGEELLVEVTLADPRIGEIRPFGLPEGAAWESLEVGGLFRWIPGIDDIGTHDVIFLVVDAEEPALVISQRTMIIDVLPKFSLIEYGF